MMAASVVGGEVYGSHDLGGGDKLGGRGGALMEGRVAAIGGLAEVARVRFRVWDFKVGR